MDLLKLFDIITDKINNGEKLKSLDNILSNYDGKDWKDYVSFDDNKYTRNIVKRMILLK